MNGIFFLIRNWKVPQRKIEQLTYCHPKLKRRTSASIYRVDGVFTVEHPQQVAIFRNFPLWHHLFNFQWGQQTKVEQLLLPFCNERTPSKTSSTREIVCLTCYYFCQLWGSTSSNTRSQDQPNSRRNVSVDVVLRQFCSTAISQLSLY
mgnify:FL=1